MSRLLAPSLLALLAVGCSDYEFIPAGEDEVEGDDTVVDNPEDTGDLTDDNPGETGAVKGRVCDTSGGDWVVGAYVYVILDYDGDGVEDDRIEGETDAEGFFTLSGLPVGTHTVHIEKGSFYADIEVTISSGVTELAEEECLDPTSVEIAVVTGQYDHIESILDGMGLEYDEYNGLTNQYLNLLQDPALMAEYDIIFFNCGMSDSWTYGSTKGVVAGNVKTYVENGGSIYSSDWAYFIFEQSFPDALDYYGEDSINGSAWVGRSGSIKGDVLDANIQAIVGGSKADLNYDLDIWVVPESAKSNVEILVQGTAPLYYGGSVSNAPLAVRFEKNGTALYTTFHNENQITVDMVSILEEIILSL